MINHLKQGRFYPLATALFLAVFILSGCNKNNQTSNQLNELQQKINEQQTKIDDLQRENDDNQQKILEYEGKLSNQSNKPVELDRETKGQNIQIDKEKTCNETRMLYISIPSMPKGASRINVFSTNIVQLYKDEKEYTKENSDDYADRVGKDLKEAVAPAYNKYIEARKLCPEFKEF